MNRLLKYLYIAIFQMYTFLMYAFCYRALIEEANVWIAKNTGWNIINCETVLLFFKQVRFRQPV